MSSVKGTNATKYDSPTIDNRMNPGIVDGRVKVFQDTYEAAALEAGSTITMGPVLPTGAQILEVILHSDDLANNTTLAVGDAEDTDRYITATDHGAGSETITRLNAIGGRNYEIDMTTASTPDNRILITTAAGAATGTIKLTVLYTND